VWKEETMNIKKILVAVDGSEHSMRAAEYAGGLAGLVGAEIILTHCHKPFPVLLGEPYFQKAINKINQETQKLMAPYEALLRQNEIPHSHRIMDGSPAEIISDVAKIEKADMIIMGSRGLNELEGLLLGSVTHRVLKTAPCPVLVIR
jgi:nucleotide-binding universal stress UspA family protein